MKSEPHGKIGYKHEKDAVNEANMCRSFLVKEGT